MVWCFGPQSPRTCRTWPAQGPALSASSEETRVSGRFHEIFVDRADASTRRVWEFISIGKYLISPYVRRSAQTSTSFLDGSAPVSTAGGNAADHASRAGVSSSAVTQMAKAV